MKRRKALFMATILAVGTVTGTAAWADPHHRGGPPRGYAPVPRVYAPVAPRFPSHHYRHDHGDRALLFGTGLVLGSALWWAATQPPAVVVAEPAPVVMVPPAPVVYSAPPPPNDGWWYYCRSSATYYPYVGSCPGPWERVAPH